MIIVCLQYYNKPANWVLAEAWAGVACIRDTTAAAAVVRPGILVQGADNTCSSDGNNLAPIKGLPSLFERRVAPEKNE